MHVAQAALLPPESIERLLQVSAFVISTYNTVKRLDRPFRNLQNSTFELVYPEKGLRAVGEKVTLPLTEHCCQHCFSHVHFEKLRLVVVMKC